MARKRRVITNDGGADKPSLRVYTIEEVRRQREAVTDGLTIGLTARQLYDKSRQTQDPKLSALTFCGLRRIERLEVDIRAQWEEEDRLSTSQKRSEAVRRIKSQMRVAMGQKNLNLHAYARLEELLADLEGTRRPIEMNVSITMNAAIVGVMSDLTEAEVVGILAEEREKQVALEAYRAGAITVPALPESGGKEDQTRH